MARVYVGTYAKYNSGSIAGKWLDLEDYASKDEFLKACHELHPEHDPEFMFQDREGVPDGYIGESWIKEELWTEWLALDEDDRELLTVYREHVNQDGGITEARDAFDGKFNSPEAWAEEFLNDTGQLESIPQNLRNYFDYEAFARDCGYDGMSFIHHDGDVWVFRL